MIIVMGDRKDGGERRDRRTKIRGRISHTTALAGLMNS